MHLLPTNWASGLGSALEAANYANNPPPCYLGVRVNPIVHCACSVLFILVFCSLIYRHPKQGYPLGVRHIFCLFDGHGGDSVADFCSNHLIDHIVDLLRAEHGPEDQREGVEAKLRDGPAAIAVCVKEACRVVDTQAGRKVYGRRSGHVVPLGTKGARPKNSSPFNFVDWWIDR